jgi:hypothetical protein
MIIDEYEAFSEFSGIRLNVPKTEIMILGKKSKMSPESFRIKYKDELIIINESEEVCICGITFSNDFSKAYNKNIIEKIYKLEKQLNLWRCRNLTLEGKILIVKTFGLSQLIYSLMLTSIRKEEILQIENIIYKFIWNNKSTNKNAIGKIKREIIKDKKANGGLNAPDIASIDKSIKLKSVLNTLVGEHPIGTVYKKILFELGFDRESYTSIGESNHFVGTAISAYKEIGIKLKNDINLLAGEVDGIHKNYFAFLQNLKLVKINLFNIHQQNSIRRMHVYGIDNLHKLITEYQNKTFPNLFLDTYQLYQEIPQSWIQLLNVTRRNHPSIENEVYIGLNKWKHMKQVTVKDLTMLFKKTCPDNVTSILNRHNMNTNNILGNPFSNLFKTIKDVKLRNLQYKILHNIYPTMKHLFKWKIAKTDQCQHCKVEESLEHAVWICPIAQNAIKMLSMVLNEKQLTDSILNLNYENVLLGIGSSKINISIRNENVRLIDELIVLLKQKLILQRDDKREVLKCEIDSMVSDRIKLHYILRKKSFKNNVNHSKCS